MLNWLENTPYAEWANESWGWPLALTIRYYRLGRDVVFSAHHEARGRRLGGERSRLFAWSQTRLRDLPVVGRRDHRGAADRISGILVPALTVHAGRRITSDATGVKRTCGEAAGSAGPTRLTRTSRQRHGCVDRKYRLWSRSDKSPVPVRPMPASVRARRVRIREIPAAIVAVIAPVLGLEAVRLRAGRLSQVPTGLGQHNGRAPL